jgi:hypothetical protein
MIKHKNRIREIHAHDMIKGFSQHQTIGTGSIDFIQCSEFFKQQNVAISIEVRPREEAEISKRS